MAAKEHKEHKKRILQQVESPDQIDIHFPLLRSSSLRSLRSFAAKNLSATASKTSPLSYREQGDASRETRAKEEALVEPPSGSPTLSSIRVSRLHAPSSHLNVFRLSELGVLAVQSSEAERRE